MPLPMSASDVTDHLVGVFQDPGILIGIPLALLGALLMSLGAQYQHRGVQKVERRSPGPTGEWLGRGQLLQLLTRPSWVFGTLMLGSAIICQLSALAFAPLILVQPLGAVSLVITTLLNAKISGHKPTVSSIRSIVSCVAGIFIFVTVAAFVATESPIDDQQLITVLLLLLGLGAVILLLWLLVLRRRAVALFYIAASGMLYGFVATLAKVIITRLQAQDFSWLTLFCAIGLLAAVSLGAYFVQTAYSAGPPDLVIAGLTVIDPIVAVMIGIVVLGEASHANAGNFAAFAVAGAFAIYGVISLARNHPQVISESQELPIERGRSGQ